MKMKPNPFIKQNNTQINKEKIDKIKMKNCPMDGIVSAEEYCIGCIFDDINGCDYNNWFPGERKGREWK